MKTSLQKLQNMCKNYGQNQRRHYLWCTPCVTKITFSRGLTTWKGLCVQSRMRSTSFSTQTRPKQLPLKRVRGAGRQSEKDPSNVTQIILSSVKEEEEMIGTKLHFARSSKIYTYRSSFCYTLNQVALQCWGMRVEGSFRNLMFPCSTGTFLDHFLGVI